MKIGPLGKGFIYFLCFSFFLMTTGFPGMMAEARENLPIGEMVSNGEVKFEARANAWKNVEPSAFSLFPGSKVKTERGAASLTLSNHTRIDVAQKSFFSFDQTGNFVLSQGSVRFHIPSTSETNFRVGNITVVKSRSLQAAKSPVPSRSEEALGMISVHPNGAVTVKSLQGNLTILTQDRVVLSSLSSNDSVTIPSFTVRVAPRTMVAQTGDNPATGGDSNGDDGWKIVGLPWWLAFLIGGGIVGGGIGVASAAIATGVPDFVKVCR